MSKSFNTEVEERQGCLWITFKKSIDMDNYKIVEEGIFTEITKTTSHKVVLDLSKTPTLFSSGVGTVMRMHTVINENNKEFYLVNVNERVQEGFETMGLDTVLKTYATQEAFQSDLDKLSEK